MQEMTVWSQGREDSLEEEMQPAPLLENPLDRGTWQATVHEVVESDMTEQLSTHACYIPTRF